MIVSKEKVEKYFSLSIQLLNTHNNGSNNPSPHGTQVRTLRVTIGPQL